MSTLTNMTTDELFADVTSRLPESTRIECIVGSLIVNPPPNFGHALAVADTRDWLATQGLRALEGVGVATGEHGWIVPDLVVLDDTADIDHKTVTIPMAALTLAVEVTSPSTGWRDRGIKRDLFHAAGVAYIVIDVEADLVECHDCPFDVDGLVERLRGERS